MKNPSYMLTYPNLLLIINYRAQFVPVGEDQVPHVEMTREVAHPHRNGPISPSQKVHEHHLESAFGQQLKREHRSLGQCEIEEYGDCLGSF